MITAQTDIFILTRPPTNAQRYWRQNTFWRRSPLTLQWDRPRQSAALKLFRMSLTSVESGVVGEWTARDRGLSHQHESAYCRRVDGTRPRSPTSTSPPTVCEWTARDRGLSHQHESAYCRRVDGTRPRSLSPARVRLLVSCTGRASARGPGRPAAHGPGRAGPE